MKQAFYGLKMFYDFLNRTKAYMESDAAVKRLACTVCTAPDSDEDIGAGTENRGVWVQLEEPKDRPNEPESTFRAFMDENVRDVFELDNAAMRQPDGRGGKGQHRFLGAGKIQVIDRDPGTSKLLLERQPKGGQLLLRPNTLTLKRQIQALQALQDAPSSSMRPLLRLTESERVVGWPDFEPHWLDSDDWLVLTDETRPGTDEQRQFVEVALATPDFVLLEGPPGSGKTTAICELILQLAQQGKRALLCASTHVAVDNVLERLMDARNPHKDLVIPVRIGERRNVSDKAGPWQLERFVRTERERLLKHLEGRSDLTESQGALLTAIQHEPGSIERMVLDAANLVCGTTMGILQHPDIKANGHATTNFDVLIIDEASKTTFQEFLVPALLAKRWVIVGDPKQLSPYVDDAEMAVNVKACLGDESARNACVDVFMAGQNSVKKRRFAAVVTDTEKARQTYLAQAAARQIVIADACSDGELWRAALVIGGKEDLERRVDELPLDISTFRYEGEGLDVLHRRAEAWLAIEKRSREEQPEWAAEISWRLSRRYEHRFAQEDEEQIQNSNSTAQRLSVQIEKLLPVAETETVKNKIDKVRRVALPSILESLRYGFERDPKARDGTALSDGIPEEALDLRHVLLSTQHRMHPDIAAFSHEHIYDGTALLTPDSMTGERSWGYGRYAQRAIWRDLRGGFDSRINANPKEAGAVIDELRAFDDWAEHNPRKDGRPWEAAVLTFYRGQEREVRNHLRRWTRKANGMRHFERGPKSRPHLTIELCTVDRFQGHEADLVIISFAAAGPTSFLESPNRLNVALTRARYQRVIIGDRMAMARAKGSALGVLASQKHWEQRIYE